MEGRWLVDGEDSRSPTVKDTEGENKSSSLGPVTSPDYKAILGLVTRKPLSCLPEHCVISVIMFSSLTSFLLSPSMCLVWMVKVYWVQGCRPDILNIVSSLSGWSWIELQVFSTSELDPEETKSLKLSSSSSWPVFLSMQKLIVQKLLEMSQSLLEKVERVPEVKKRLTES